MLKIYAVIITLLTTSVVAEAANEQWDEKACAQAMLGFKSPDELSEKVTEFRAKIANGDKSQETEDILVFYRDIEWYCLKR